MDVYSYLPTVLRKFSKRTLIIGAIVIGVILLIGARHFLNASGGASATQSSNISQVTVASVGSLSAQTGPLTVVGTAKSENQATILAQTSGEITSLSRSIGAHVVAGQVIGQFENSSQRAAVVQAQGAYDAAQAGLQKAMGTTAANSGINSAQASTAANNAAASLSTALASAYASLDDAIHTKSDALFANPTSQNPQLFAFAIPDSQLVVNINTGRLNLNTTLSDAQTEGDPASGKPLDDRAVAMLTDLRTVSAFLADMITALNKAVPNSIFSAATISADQASLAAARSEVLAAISSVTGAKSAYDSALAGAQTASNSATAGTQSDIAAAQANVKSAQGALLAAQANLEKTIIRSPISGTIVSLPVTQGDFVSNFAQVAVVSNPGALYIDAQVTPDDAKTIAVGNGAQVESTIPGTITFVAPALDPATGKIEVKVGLTGTQGDLTDGEAVTLALERNKTTASASGAAALQMTIPIVAVKITPTGPIVFTVHDLPEGRQGSTLVAQPITLGAILGDRVVVTGVTSDTQIITDARGHSVGETVTIAPASATH